MTGIDLSDPVSEFDFLGEVAEDAGLDASALPAVERRTLGLAAEVGGAERAQLAGIVWGSGPHELVFLHGGAQNSHTWDTALLALGRDVVAVDLPGHGRSSWRADGRYGPEVIAPAVRAGVHAWAAPPAPRAVVGFSLGGLTALAVAAQEPELVPALVLVDVTPGAGRPDGPSPLPAMTRSPEGWASRQELFDLATAAWPGRSARSLRRGLVHNTVVRDDGRVVWRHHFGNMGDGPPTRATLEMDRTRLWEALDRLPGPVMLVRGGASPVVSDDDEVEVRRRRPDATVHVLDGLGHDVPGEAPLVLAGFLKEFLAGTA